VSDGCGGIHTGGYEKKSSLPLSDVVTIQKNGPRKNTRAAKSAR
jgi:hypothetical protein